MKYTIELTSKQKDTLECVLAIVHRYIGFNAKLEMDIPIPMKESPAYKKGFEDGNKIADKDLKAIRLSTYDVAYNKALNDVNHAMDVLKGMTVAECKEWFESCIGIDDVVCEFTVQRIIEITKAYEEKKETEIKVGDEVVSISGNKAIVTMVDDNTIFVVYNDGSCGDFNKESLKKTGKHYKEVIQLLDKLKGVKSEE